MITIDPFGYECFLAVAETQSFTKASEKVKRTQSALSQQIAKLETLLGKPLFTRGKQITLTEDGKLFYAYAKKIMMLQHEALLHFTQPVIKGEVRFGLPEDFSALFLDQVLKAFYTQYPGILINIECDLSLNLLERFNQKEFDLILYKSSDSPATTMGQEVWSEKLEWVIVKEGYDKNFQNQSIPLILSPSPCIYRARALEALEAKSLKWHITFTSTGYNSKIAAVKAGLGITILPKSMIPQGFEAYPGNYLPPLFDTHFCLLKHTNTPQINTFEAYILNKLRH